jgi:hypothetical protein
MRARDGGTLNQTDRVYLQDRLDRLASIIHGMKHDGWRSNRDGRGPRADAGPPAVDDRRAIARKRPNA